MDKGIDHITLGHDGGVITIDPETGDYVPEPYWYCYSCDEKCELAV